MKLVLAIVALTTLGLIACGGGSRVGETVSRFELKQGDCYSSGGSLDAILLIACADADRRVLATGELEGTDFPGASTIADDANALCREKQDDQYDKLLTPDGNTWALGDRTVVCLEDRSGAVTSDPNDDDGTQDTSPPDDAPPNDSGFDNSALSGRWNTSGGGYSVLSLSDEYEIRGQRVAVYSFVDYGLFGKTGDGVITVFEDGSAELEGSAGLNVFICFDVEVAGRLHFTDRDFFGQIWCIGDPSDAVDMSGTRAGARPDTGQDDESSGNDSSNGGGNESSSESPVDASSIPLESSHVSALLRVVHPSEVQPAAAERELGKVVASGQEVISCEYGPSDPETGRGYVTYEFWYEDVPDNIDDLLSVAGESGAPHPVFRLGRNSISSCPESRDEAEAAWRAGRS